MYMKFPLDLAMNEQHTQPVLLDGYAYLARYYDPVIGRFTSFDSFEADPANPNHLNKYLYAGADPIQNSDPSGHDWNLTSISVTAGIGAALGAIGTAATNYALGRAQTFRSIASGALFGGILLPLSIAVPAIGVGAAAYGIYSNWNLTWQVWANTRSSPGQRSVALVLFGTSLFAGYAAGSNAVANGWYNPTFEVAPPSPNPLNSSSTLAQIFPGVGDDVMIHFSPVQPTSLNSPIYEGSFWARFGDIKNLTPGDYQSEVVGGGAAASAGDTPQVVYFYKPGLGDVFVQDGAGLYGRTPEFRNSAPVTPDAASAIPKF